MIRKRENDIARIVQIPNTCDDRHLEHVFLTLSAYFRLLNLSLISLLLTLTIFLIVLQANYRLKVYGTVHCNILIVKGLL